jgi:hypothetical protein
VLLLGTALLFTGWWRLRNCSSWRDWGCGLAGMLIGWPTASFGLGWLLQGIF